MKKMQGHDGFSAVMVILILVIVGIIGFTGWYVYNSVQKNNNNKALDSASDSAVSNQAKSTPKADSTSGWKTYTNDRYKFSFKYPNYTSFAENDASAPYWLAVDAVYMGSLSNDAPMGGDKDTAEKDLAALKKGDPTTIIGPAVPSSYKLLNINGAYGKKYTTFHGMLSACLEDFRRDARIYKNINGDDILIRISSNILENQIPKVEAIKAANPKYFQKTSECSYESYGKNYDGYKMLGDQTDFYIAVENGQSDQLSQQWFTDFDKILASFKFN